MSPSLRLRLAMTLVALGLLSSAPAVADDPLRAAPALLAALRANVENPPREFADLGLIVAKGSVSFFRTDLVGWAKTAAGGDTQLLAEFEAANAPAVAGFEASVLWLQNDLLP